MTSNHDAKIPFGIKAQQGKDTSCILKFKKAAVGHISGHFGKLVQPMAQKRFVLETIMIRVF